MSNTTKATNDEILQAVAEAASRGGDDAVFDAGDGQTAVKLMGSRSLSTAVSPGTALFSAAVGLLAKIVSVNLSYAQYTDVYAKHHRGYVEGGDVELGFIEKATAGTGNAPMGAVDSFSAPTYTTVTTADAAVLKQYYGRYPAARVARIPISEEDVKPAFTSRYGIEDYIEKQRAALNNKIVDDVNGEYDGVFLTAAQGAVAAGSGSAISANYVKATYKAVPGVPNPASGTSWAQFADQITEKAALAILIELKRIALHMLGRPNSLHNACGVSNNVKRPEDLVIYVNSDVYAQLSSVTAFAYNMSELRERGVEIQPLAASWLETAHTSTGGRVIAFVGSVDWARDWLTVDYTRTVPTDAGVIVARKSTGVLAVCGYEPACFITADPTAAGTPTKVTVSTGFASVTANTVVTGKRYIDGVLTPFSYPGGGSTVAPTNVVELYIISKASTAYTAKIAQGATELATFDLSTSGNTFVDWSQYLSGSDLTITFTANG